MTDKQQLEMVFSVIGFCYIPILNLHLSVNIFLPFGTPTQTYKTDVNKIIIIPLFVGIKVKVKATETFCRKMAS